MAHFVLTRHSLLPPAVCWERLTDWPRHGERVPFTRVSVGSGSGRRVGDVIVARTALGPVRLFDDPMEITEFCAPAPGGDGVCRLEKRGRPVLGGAELRVRAVDGGRGSRSEVTWAETVALAGVPGVFDPVVAGVGRLVFGRVLDRLLA
ncbi:SRPBCC family protein [Kitasatospora sp. NPDC047058]|uniref:SRPBCC family protein n=1 Tax=Kitasatospora sp. NPDC047058 TaxID=3155620 RepID=UPI0033FB47D0